MSDIKKSQPKVEELDQKDLNQVDGGIAIIGYSADRSITQDQVQVEESTAKFDQNLKVDPLAVNIQRG